MKNSPLARQCKNWRIVTIVMSALTVISFITTIAIASSVEQNIIDFKTGIIGMVIALAAFAATTTLTNACSAFCARLRENLKRSAARKTPNAADCL